MGNSGTIVQSALIKKWTKDGGEGNGNERWVKKGQEGEKGWWGCWEESRSRWEPGSNRSWDGRGKWRKREVWRKVVRGPSLILVFFFHTIIVSFFSPSPSCFHILLSSNTPLYPVFPSQPFIDTSILHHSKSHLLYSFHLPFVPLFFFFFLHLGWWGMFCLSYHLCITFPIQCRRERGGGGREKRREKKKKRSGSGGRWMRGAWESKRGRTETKRKDHTASWLNEHGQRMITIEYIMLLLAEAIN